MSTLESISRIPSIIETARTAQRLIEVDSGDEGDKIERKLEVCRGVTQDVVEIAAQAAGNFLPEIAEVEDKGRALLEQDPLFIDNGGVTRSQSLMDFNAFLTEADAAATKLVKVAPALVIEPALISIA